jgi:signal transduction histidine kinase
MEKRGPAPIHYPAYQAWTEMLAGLSEKNARLSDLVAKRCPPRSGAALITELERERTRIARELHAGAGQPLAGIKLHLEILSECISVLPDSARHAIGRLRTLADEALGQVRAVSHRLHPPDWQEMSVKQALESLIESSGLGGRCSVTLDLRATPTEPAHGVKVQIYRCAQECISNVIRHSGATTVCISLSDEDDRIVLTVADNGRGFDTSARNTGIGLRAIAETAASIGGTSRITSGSDGTRIKVSLPSSAD